MDINQINLNISDFNIREVDILGDDCVLIYPKHSDSCWTLNNLHYRSVILRKCDNKVISRGFPKFFNVFQSPEVNIFPDGPFSTYTKKDGSLLIFSYFKDEVLVRTRNSVSIEGMANGHEIHILKNKYPKLWAAVALNTNHSILCEWQTKSNVIVIDEVDEPTLTLIGCIENDTGILVKQSELDKIAETWGLPRPEQYTYNTLAECLEDVKMWEGKEGVVRYSEDGQYMDKIKSEWYLIRHKLATGIKNISQVLDLFMDSPKFTTYDQFYNFVVKTLSYEVAERLKDDMLKIVNAYNKTLEQLDNVRLVVHNVRGDSFTRRDQAIEIVQHFPDWRKSAAFTILDNKVLEDKVIKTGIESNLLNTNL